MGADNGYAEEAVTSKAVLIVEYPPSVSLESVGDGTLSCAVEASPTAEVTWWKEGKRVRRGVTQSHSLTLLEVGEEDSGNYTCKAENRLGREEATIRIPGLPSILSVNIQPVSNKPLCYLVTVQLYSESALVSARLEYRSTYSPGWEEKEVATVGVGSHVWEGEKTLCDLTHNTHYIVRLGTYNTQYNFTTPTR